MNNGRRRVTVRPGKGQGMLGGVVGVIFVGIGFLFVIPTFGVFGLLWTLVAGCIAAFNFYSAFGKGYVGPEICIDGEPDGEERPEHRLERLRTLYEQRLITQEEYEQKRKEILKEL